VKSAAMVVIFVESSRLSRHESATRVDTEFISYRGNHPMHGSGGGPLGDPVQFVRRKR
jgi:hypothetical protein